MTWWRVVRLASIAGALALGLSLLARAGNEQAIAALDAAAASDLPNPQGRLAWIDPSGRAGIDEIAAGRGDFRRVAGDGPHPLGSGSALWLKLRLQRGPAVEAHWRIEFPVPVLDRVTLFLQDASSGRWQSWEAGDQVPQSDWPEPGRYPAFAVQLPPEAPVQAYVRIEHASALSLPVRLSPLSAHLQNTRMEYLALGVAFGGLLLLVAGAVWQALLLRDKSSAWFATFGMLALLGVAAYTGVAAHLLWGELTVWSDAAPGCLALLAGAVLLHIVGQFTLSASRRTRWLRQPVRIAAWFGPALAAAYMYIDRPWGTGLLAGYLGISAVLVVAAAGVGCHRGEPAGRWMMAGSAPLAVAVGLALARLLGWIQGSWAIEYAVVAAVALNLPMLRAALAIRLHERRSAQLRQQALASHDPLTGLAKTAPFRSRLRRVLARYASTGEPACLVVVAVANLTAVKVSRGAEAAEECLLRGVIKMQRLVREVDSMARVGDNCFALILEGVSSRAQVSDFASHLVASGLMQDPDHPGDPLLQFHVAAALFTEQPSPAVALLEALQQLLSTMSPRTRRPIRYLQPGSDRDDTPSELAPLPQALGRDRIPEVI